jgi:hypothetical protein
MMHVEGNDEMTKCNGVACLWTELCMPKQSENTDGENTKYRKNKEYYYNRPKFGIKQKLYFKNIFIQICISQIFKKYNGQMSA